MGLEQCFIEDYHRILPFYFLRCDYCGALSEFSKRLTRLDAAKKKGWIYREDKFYCPNCKDKIKED